MSAQLDDRDAWAAYYAANAAVYRANAEKFRREAEAALLIPFGDADYRKRIADKALAHADRYEQMAREQMGVEL